MASVSTLPAHRWLSEPLLAFHPERDEDSHVHPLEGLLEYGPYSRSLMSQVYDPLRVAAIYPFGMGRRIDGLLKEMEQQHLPQERRAYLRPFPGFSRVFGLKSSVLLTAFRLSSRPVSAVKLPVLSSHTSS